MPPVRERAARSALAGQHRLAHERVREPEAPGRGALVDQPRRDRGVELLREPLVARLAGGGHVGQREVLAGDRRHPHRPHRELGQPREPLVDHRPHADRDAGARRGHERGAGLAGVRLEQLADQLLDEQGVAAGPRVQDGGERRGRRPRAEPGARELRRLGLGEAAERHAREAARTGELGEELGERGPRVLLPDRARDEQRRPADRPDHVREHLERGAVGPVEVLDDQEHGSAPGRLADRRRDRLEQAMAGVLAGGRRAGPRRARARGAAARARPPPSPGARPARLPDAGAAPR